MAAGLSDPICCHGLSAHRYHIVKTVACLITGTLPQSPTLSHSYHTEPVLSGGIWGYYLKEIAIATLPADFTGVVAIVCRF